MKKFLAPRLALVASAIVTIAACSSTSDGPLAPVSRTPLGVIGTATGGEVQVCLAAGIPAGSYTFTTTQTNAAAPASAPDQVNSPVTINTTDVQTCQIVFTRTYVIPNSNNSSPVGTLSVTASGAAGTFTFTCSEQSTGFCGGQLTGTNPATPGANAYHGSLVTFNFSPTIVPPPPPPPPPPAGCTYTQGYWKNPGKATTAALTINGVNALTLLNTPPRGNVYYILVHQYIAAKLNLANGASLTGDALTAYNAATAYFSVASIGNPTPTGYTTASVTALATTLDNYNNGIIGPGHCS